MSTDILNKSVKKLTDHITSTEAEKKASTVVKAICIVTDKKNVKESQKLVDLLEDIIGKKLPSKQSLINMDHVTANYASVNENLQKIDAFLDVINKIFNSYENIEMDESTLYNVLANIQKAQKHLTYISDYLSLVLDIQKEKLSNKTTTSFADLITTIKAA